MPRDEFLWLLMGLLLGVAMTAGMVIFLGATFPLPR